MFYLAMYGKLLVLLMIAFCLIEVMDNNVKPFTFQVKQTFYKGDKVIFLFFCRAYFKGTLNHRLTYPFFAKYIIHFTCILEF